MYFSRRKFLCGATAAAFNAGAFVRALGETAQAASTTNTIVIVYDLNGGNDGFNTIVPLTGSTAIAKQNSAYATLRSNIALSTASIQAAGTNFDATPSAVGMGSTYGFNPVMTSFRSLYAQGKVAIVSGVGVPANVPNRSSHQQGSFYWATGAIDYSAPNVGWAGIAIDQLNITNSFSPLVSVNGNLPTVLRAQKTVPLVVGGDLGSFNANTGPLSKSAGIGAIQANDAYATAPISSEYARSIGSQTTGDIAAVQAYAKAVNPDSLGGGPLSPAYPASANFAPYQTNFDGTTTYSITKTKLAQIARLIIAGAPTRAYYLMHNPGYFDTHSAQLPRQGNLLQEFSEATSEFYAYLRMYNKSSNVIIMTTGDFGRTPWANGNAGTDHGTSTFHFVIGDPVKGGMYSTNIYPDLTPGLSGGYVNVDIDFRYYLSAVIQSFGVDPQTVLGTSAFTNLAGAGANLGRMIA